MSNKKADLNEKLNSSRRDFLRQVLQTSGGAAALKGMGSMTFSVFEQILSQKAHADPNFNKNYIFIQLPGAPSRWTFDLFLTPYGRTNFNFNPMMGTRYVASGGRYVGVEYATFNYRNTEVPYLWKFSVPKAGGGTRPMTDLLDHLLVLRGISTDNPGHPGSMMLQFEPLGSRQSLTALTADKSERPFAAINMNTQQYSLRSLAGKSPVLAEGGSRNLIQQLMQPFITGLTPDFLAKRAALESALGPLREALNKKATSRHGAAKAQVVNQQGARQLGTQQEDLGAIWDALLSKYTDLAKRAIATNATNTNLPGLTDLPIGTTGTRDQTYSLNPNFIAERGDLREMIDSETQIPNMAEYFALTEYIMTRRLSSSVALPMTDFTNLRRNDAGARATSTFDEHNGGQMVVLLLRSLYYRALSACMLELIDKLKAEGMFADTVLHLSSEFTRNPRADKFGSDHGWQGASISLFSGLITAPLILGNITSAFGDANYPGTWGAGAPVANLGKSLNYGHVAATIAALLGVPSPLTSDGPVVAVESSGIRALIERGKIVK